MRSHFNDTMLEMAVLLRRAIPDLEVATAAKILSDAAADLFGAGAPKLRPEHVAEGVKEMFGFEWEELNDNVDAVNERMASAHNQLTDLLAEAAAARAAVAAAARKKP